MRVYLVQHAEALSEEEDEARPLSKEGRDNISRMAKYAAQQLDISVDQILHSGKTRARQTARILADELTPSEGVKQAEGLGPLDNPRKWGEHIAETDRILMLVGHLPYMSRLASFLVIGDEEEHILSVRNAGINCLEEKDGAWSIRFVITPEMLS
ncbi:MAG: phosphohistidine phosphatase SixA [Candidatus Thorarchaeota archaeon]|nr:phosphohistidine phosphatase SixA [Candidatus Thorarchaeota archaeon]